MKWCKVSSRDIFLSPEPMHMMCLEGRFGRIACTSTYTHIHHHFVLSVRLFEIARDECVGINEVVV